MGDKVKSHIAHQSPLLRLISQQTATLAAPATRLETQINHLFKVCSFVLYLAIFLSSAIIFQQDALAWDFDIFKLNRPGFPFAIEPDLNIRRIDPTAPEHAWNFGYGWGLPPLFFRSKVPGFYDRSDFFYPLGQVEETRLSSKLRFTPFFESHWSKIPPFDGYSRCLTLFHGRSDMGQEYWGFFPIYGFMHRKFGVDHNFFLLFPIYYQSTDDSVRTHRILWPLITYADSPGRSSLKFWPIYGHDHIGDDYHNRFLFWPFFQHIEKYTGTEQASSYWAMPFPLIVKRERLLFLLHPFTVADIFLLQALQERVHQL